MNDPKLKLHIARMLPEQLHEIYPCDDRTMEEVQKANEVSWCWNEPRRRVLETEWLYIVSLVEQTLSRKMHIQTNSERNLYVQELIKLNGEYGACMSDFNQRATALCRVKGITIE